MSRKKYSWKGRDYKSQPAGNFDNIAIGMAIAYDGFPDKKRLNKIFTDNNYIIK